ncbi:MAG: hypothetical protein K6B41_13230 [Butyrivibrio sp.]|nr:hypothetical protein [Butyrivibrio sp.]
MKKRMVLSAILIGTLCSSSIVMAAPSPTASVTYDYSTTTYDYSTTTNDYSTSTTNYDYSTTNNDYSTTNNYNIKVSGKAANTKKVTIKMGSSSSSSGSTPTVTLSSGNYVDPVAGKTLYQISQGGKVILNGSKSRATFMVSSPTTGKVTSAETLAASVNGTLLGVVDTSAPGVVFKTARVNFYVKGLSGDENVAAYQYASGKWSQLNVSEVRKDHVVVDMTGHGTLAFVQVN